MSDNEPNIIKEFRALYDYVRLMGENIIQIRGRLDQIEKSINDINLTHNNYVRENAREILGIKDNMVNKNEFNELIERMRASMSETLPPLPIVTIEKPIEESESIT